MSSDSRLISPKAFEASATLEEQGGVFLRKSAEQQVENEADPEVLLHMRRDRVESGRSRREDVATIPLRELKESAEAPGHRWETDSPTMRRAIETIQPGKC